jgi:hypothetical protein
LLTIKLDTKKLKKKANIVHNNNNNKFIPKWGSYDTMKNRWQYIRPQLKQLTHAEDMYAPIDANKSYILKDGMKINSNYQDAVTWTQRSYKKGDFKKSDFEVIKDIDLGEIPILFVVKKNSSTLGNLLSYFENKIPENKEQIEEPLLIIDDECDHGSINTNDPYQSTNPTKLNSQIRGLLAHFKRCAYIAYTATPFANIFINPEESKLKISLQGGLVKDEQGNVIWEIKGKTRRKKREEIIKAAQDYDLFPRDFIVNLPIADNYIGAKKIFNLPKDLDDDFESNPLPIVISLVSASTHETPFSSSFKASDKFI